MALRILIKVILGKGSDWRSRWSQLSLLRCIEIELTIKAHTPHKFPDHVFAKCSRSLPCKYGIFIFHKWPLKMLCFFSQKTCYWTLTDTSSWWEYSPALNKKIKKNLNRFQRDRTSSTRFRNVSKIGWLQN